MKAWLYFSSVVLIVLTGCANSQRELAEVSNARVTSVQASARPSPPPSAPVAMPTAFTPSTASPDHHHDVVLMAMAMMDRNYTYGGKKLNVGFDCSGFVSFVYQESVKKRLEGNSADQAKQTLALPSGQERPGDLVFFNTTGAANSHVGIYVGEGRFVHAENERTGIRASRLDQAYWSKRFEGFRRVAQ